MTDDGFKRDNDGYPDKLEPKTEQPKKEPKDDPTRKEYPVVASPSGAAI